MMYNGNCHCGKISFKVEAEVESLLQCNCSICSKRGYLLFFVPRGSLTLNIPEQGLQSYTFNKHRIQHHFCSDCGCSPIAIGADDQGNEMVAVNARCLEDMDLSLFEINNFDGRSL